MNVRTFTLKAMKSHQRSLETCVQQQTDQTKMLKTPPAIWTICCHKRCFIFFTFIQILPSLWHPNALWFTQQGSLKKKEKRGKKEALTTSDCVSQPGIYTTLWLLKVHLCFFFPSSKQRGFLRFLSELVVMGQLDDDKLVKTFQVRTGSSPVSDLQTRIPCKKKKRKEKKRWREHVWNWHRCRKIGSTTRPQLHGSHGRGQGSRG